MTKGKLWSPELEKALRDLVAAKTSLGVIAKKLGKPVEAVRVKVRRFGLEVVDQWKKNSCSSTTAAVLVLPKELFSVEEVLKELHAAVVGWRLVIRRVRMMMCFGRLRWLCMRLVRCRQSRFWRLCLGDCVG